MMKTSKKETRERLAQSRMYQWLKRLSTYMDTYYLDAIAGFLLPGGIGDTLCAVVSLAYAWFAFFVVRSVPLTFAVLNNTLTDLLVGIIPFYVGDVMDVFYRSNRKNLRLVEGFVENDEAIVHEVNRKATWFVLKFVVLLVLLGLMVWLLVWLVNLLDHFVVSLF